MQSSNLSENEAAGIAKAVKSIRPPMINSLTSIRFFIAFYVFLYHFEIRMQLIPVKALENVVLNGYVGMSWFFVLSGFVLTIRYWKDAIDYPEFILARFARIYPAFLVSFVLSYPSIWVHRDVPLPTAGGIALYTITTLSLTRAWFPNVNPVGIGGTWSLSVEMFFYLLFPVIISAFRKIENPTRSFLIKSAIVLWFASFVAGLCQLILPMQGTTGFYYSSPTYRLPEFILGIIAAYAWKSSAMKITLLPILVVTGFYCLACYFFNGGARDNMMIINVLAVPLIGMILIYAAATPPRFLEWRVFIYLGEISYGIYLFQFVFTEFLFTPLRNHLPGHPWIVFTADMVTTFGLAAISYRFFEAPLRARIKRFPIHRFLEKFS